jgi:hypothetical protein
MMKRLLLRRVLRCLASVLVGSLLAGFTAACHKSATTATDASLQDAFKDGSPEAKRLADAAADALQKQDRPQAFLLLQNLSASTDLTPEERRAAAKAAADMRAQLAKAATNGDQEAAALLQAYRSNK